MRILIVTSRYLPHRGGLETTVHYLGQEFAGQGHQVLLVTNRHPYHLPRKAEMDGLSVRRLLFLVPLWRHLRAGRLDLFLASLWFFPATLLSLTARLARFKPDVVNLHYLGLPGFFLWLIHHVRPFRWIVSLHGSDVEEEPHKGSFNRWLFQAVLSRADGVTACSEFLLEQAQVMVPQVAGKGRVIRNGVDEQSFATAQPFQHTAPYLLAVGRLAYHKGLDVLIDAFARVAQSYPRLHLLIAGSGPDYLALQAQIQAAALSTRIRLLGLVSHQHVAALMRGSLAIVIPSRREAFGLVGLEAMASGRPIIASRVRGLEETLAGACVDWCAPGDVSQLESTLRALLARGDDGSAEATINQQLASRSDWQGVADQYLKVLA